MVEDTWEFTAAAICRQFHGRELTGTGTTAAASRQAAAVVPGPGCSGINKPDSGDWAGCLLYILTLRLMREMEAVI